MYRQKLQRRAVKNVSTKAIDKFSPYDVILAPVLTEKTYKQQDVDNKDTVNKYVFRVHKDANKNDVKAAVSYLYKVSPLKVNIVNVVFKGRNQRKLVRKAYKKAVVTLTGKEKIELGI